MSTGPEHVVNPGHDAFRLSPGLVALGYFLKYVGLALYGITAAVIEVPSFVLVGGSRFAFGWAVTVVVFAIFAAVAVVRTWRTGRVLFEKRVTAALILTFLSYSVVLVVRAIMTDTLAAASLAWIPFVLTIFPIIRYYTLVGRR